MLMEETCPESGFLSVNVFDTVSDCFGCSDEGACAERQYPIRQLADTEEQKRMDKTFFDLCIDMIRSKTKESPKVYKYNALDFGSLLHKNKQKVRMERLTDKRGFNLLHVIVMEGRRNLLQPLFDVGVFGHLVEGKIQESNSVHYGKTPEGIAQHFKMDKIRDDIQRLKEVENSMTMMHKKARSGEQEAVSLLIKNHPQMMETQDREGSTALTWAVTSGKLQIVKVSHFTNSSSWYSKVFIKVVHEKCAFKRHLGNSAGKS